MKKIAALAAIAFLVTTGAVAQSAGPGAPPAGPCGTFTNNAQSGTTYTVLTSDFCKQIVTSNSAAVTITVPSGLGTPFQFSVRQDGAGQVTLVQSGTTLNTVSGSLSAYGQYAGMVVTAEPTANIFDVDAASNALLSAQILVGNASNVATAVAVSGDITLNNIGKMLVNAIMGTSIGGTTGTAGTNVVLSNAPIITQPTLSGSQIVSTRVVTASGAVTVSATTDYVVIVNKGTGAATTVNLPASPATGLTFFIKDGKGDAATNNITITPAAGNIDGASTYVITSNYGAIQITYNGTQWNIL